MYEKERVRNIALDATVKPVGKNAKFFPYPPPCQSIINTYRGGQGQGGRDGKEGTSDEEEIGKIRP